MFWGKVIGALIGLKGVPLGVLIGVLVGHWIDRRISRRRRAGNKPPRGTAERNQLYSVAVVNLAAKLAKVDGPVTRREVDAFKAVFTIPSEQKSAIGKLYDQAKRDAAGYEPHAEALAVAFAAQPGVLAEVLDALYRIAEADGPIGPAESVFLQRVAAIFGLPGRSSSERRVGSAQNDPYLVLGVARAAPMADIKAAWRRLIREHHPDSLMAKGMPKENIDQATRRMAAINAAYDQIRTERGEA